MKKKIMVAASVALIACGAFLGVKKSAVNKSGDLLLANVEALAETEYVATSNTRFEVTPKGLREYGYTLTPTNLPKEVVVTETSGQYNYGTSVGYPWAVGVSIGYTTGTTSNSTTYSIIYCCKTSADEMSTCELWQQDSDCNKI